MASPVSHAATHPTDPLRVRTTRADDRIVLDAAGMLDAAGADVLRAAIAAAGPADVTVDLAKVARIDAAGLSELARAKRELDGQGRSFVLRSVSPAVLRLLVLSGMDSAFDVR
jgi:anti-anti-sigma factor